MISSGVWISPSFSRACCLAEKQRQDIRGMSSFDAEDKVWSGPRVVHEEDGLPFREMVLEKLSSKPTKVFQISDSDKQVLTYAQMKVLSVRVAQNLHRFGVNKRDVVAAFFSNSAYIRRAYRLWLHLCWRFLHALDIQTRDKRRVDRTDL